MGVIVVSIWANINSNVLSQLLTKEYFTYSRLAIGLLGANFTRGSISFVYPVYPDETPLNTNTAHQFHCKEPQTVYGPSKYHRVVKDLQAMK